MQRRTFSQYADVLYRVQALAFVVYPYHQVGRGFMDAIYKLAGIEVEPGGSEPTLSQLWAVEAFLLNELQEMHEETLAKMEEVA